MEIKSTDGSHLHRHVRIASKVLAIPSVTRVVSEFEAGNTYENTSAYLKFFTESGELVGNIKTNVSKITQLHDNSFTHECSLKMKNGRKLSPIHAY